MWILLSNIDLRCFVARQFLSQIYALLSEKFPGLKMCECKKMTNMRYGAEFRPSCNFHKKVDYEHVLADIKRFEWIKWQLVKGKAASDSQREEIMEMSLPDFKQDFELHHKYKFPVHGFVSSYRSSCS